MWRSSTFAVQSFDYELPVVLSSWKQVAQFFGKSIRTVQRWERELGLPIHRPNPSQTRLLFALEDELMAWSKSPKHQDSHPSAEKLLELHEQLRQRGIDFLKVELDLGVTYAYFALSVRDGSGARIRIQAHARKCYDTFMRLHRRLPLTELPEIKKAQIEDKLTQLRSALRELGENLESSESG